MGVGNPFHQIEIEFTGAQYRKNPPKSIPFNFYNRIMFLAPGTKSWQWATLKDIKLLSVSLKKKVNKIRNKTENETHGNSNNFVCASGIEKVSSCCCSCVRHVSFCVCVCYVHSPSTSAQHRESSIETESVCGNVGMMSLSHARRQTSGLLPYPTRRGRYWQSEKKKLNQSSNTWKRLLRKEKMGASVTAQARARGGTKTTLLLVDIEEVGSLLKQQWTERPVKHTAVDADAQESAI